ncbi:MAG: 1-deoxy-D-xylulose-5-phosphate synthase N-terminal domain-containing protein [Sulfolobales archaeon]|nr:thiamine pyrophosphate-dependent enzyme [Desulfurococcaceae archaeon]
MHQIKTLSEYVRTAVIDLHHIEKNLHMGSTLSCIEILTVLVSKYIRRSSDKLNRDWLILSKGHAAPALYVLLAEVGIIPREELVKIQSINSILQGHPDISIPGVDMSTGSLGQGLSFAVGIATWIKFKGGYGRVYVIMGDGEQDEGQVWEAMTDAVRRGLDNLLVIIDVNDYQLDGKTSEVKPKHYMPLIWKTVGWEVFVCDGHDIISLINSIDNALSCGRPSVIFAKTVRGRGLKPIEGTELQRVE